MSDDRMNDFLSSVTQDAPRPIRTFVLVSGSWFPSGVWGSVKRELEARGHRVFTPELPGWLPNDGADPAKVTFDDYVQTILDVIRPHQLVAVTLVVWSMSGIIAQRLIGEIAANGPTAALARVIFWNTFVPAPTSTLMQSVDAAQPGASEVFVSASQANGGTLPLTEDMLIAMLAPDVDQASIRHLRILIETRMRSVRSSEEIPQMT